tara:strand:- start:249 stop:500 length:252 start_codon:yes stop_codon:yes gene_type:complete
MEWLTQDWFFQLNNAFAVIGSFITVSLVAGKTNKQRWWGFLVAVLISPSFFYIGWHTGAWAIVILSAYRFIESFRGMNNNKNF